MRVDGQLLAGYHRDVHALTLRYLQQVSAAELQRVVDEGWDPPVTAAVRLVSVLGVPFEFWALALFAMATVVLWINVVPPRRA